MGQLSKQKRGVVRRNGYRLIVGGPVPPQAGAITFGRTIVVRPNHADSESLIAHELVHVRQFKELGTPRFLLRYVGSYLRHRLAGYGHMAAYRRIPLEVEASWLSRLHTAAELEPSAAEGPDDFSSARHPRAPLAQQVLDRAEIWGLRPPSTRSVTEVGSPVSQ